MIITGNKDKDIALKISSFRKIGEIDAGIDNTELGTSPNPKNQAAAEVIAIDKIKAPFNLYA